MPAISGLNVRSRHEALQHVVEALEVGADGESLSVRICCPLVSKKKALVWPSFLAIRKHAVRGLHDGVDLVGVGDEHVLELERKLHEQRLA